jgi:hypothetical protein
MKRFRLLLASVAALVTCLAGLSLLDAAKPAPEPPRVSQQDTRACPPPWSGSGDVNEDGDASRCAPRES